MIYLIVLHASILLLTYHMKFNVTTSYLVVFYIIYHTSMFFLSFCHVLCLIDLIYEQTEQDTNSNNNNITTNHHVKVIIPNQCKDNNDFYNFLVMKSVLNVQGVESYVIGLQFDISGGFPTLDVVQKVDHLMELLPNTM